MRTIVNHHGKRDAKRSVFGELKEGMAVLAEAVKESGLFEPMQWNSIAASLISA